VDTNKVTLITQESVKELPLCTKEETADLILDSIKDFINN
jgi:phosphopantothenoylcysteine decarboxylase/phosphopantothenate--cysteine ligase